MWRGGDSIGRILVIEFSERDSVVFDEVMEVLKQRLEFENLQLKDESLLSIPGLEIYPNRKFNEDDWYSFVEYATVYGKDDIWFIFKNGMEIKA